MAKESGSVPFRWWIERNAVRAIDLSLIPPDDWDGWEARYDNELERKKKTTRALSRLAEPIQKIFERMRSAYWQNEWSNELGYALHDDHTLHGGGLHVTEPGGSLCTHLDYAAHPYVTGMERRLNLIAFLNPEWRPEWGGALQLCDPMGVPVKKIYPEPGTVVGFETGDDSYHGVEMVACPLKCNICGNAKGYISGAGECQKCWVKVADQEPGYVNFVPNYSTCVPPPRVTAAVYFLSPLRPGVTRRRAMYMPVRGTM